METLKLEETGVNATKWDVMYCPYYGRKSAEDQVFSYLNTTEGWEYMIVPDPVVPDVWRIYLRKCEGPSKVWQGAKPDYIILDDPEEPMSDKRTFDSGAVRDSRTGKGRYDCIYSPMLTAVALRLEGGAVHYGDRNWEKGMDVSTCFDSCMRHLQQFWMGETDEDHLAAAICNAMFMMYMIKERPTFDDRPRYTHGFKDNRSDGRGCDSVQSCRRDGCRRDGAEVCSDVGRQGCGQVDFGKSCD